MLARRIIACLDVRNGSVVKGVNFEGLANAGDPAALARRYNAEGIDELVILDVTATIETRRALADTIRAVRYRVEVGLARVLIDLPMPCGTGDCFACAVETRHGIQLACAGGPAFDLSEFENRRAR